MPLLHHAPDLPGPGLVRGIGQPGERAVEDCLEADLQYNITLHYITLQYSTVQYSTVQYSTVQYSTVQYSTCRTGP